MGMENRKKNGGNFDFFQKLRKKSLEIISRLFLCTQVSGHVNSINYGTFSFQIIWLSLIFQLPDKTLYDCQ